MPPPSTIATTIRPPPPPASASRTPPSWCRSTAPKGEPDERPRTTHVLVVDDEPTVRRSLARVLMTSGFEVSTAEDASTALSLLEAGTIDVMLVDLLMPRMSGMELLGRVKEQHPAVEVVMMTAHANVDDAVAAVKNGAYDYLTKPFSSNDAVTMAIAKAAERKSLFYRMGVLEARLEQRESFGGLVGSTPKMREVYRIALGVAPTQATVLILGESGTGKELIARAIHKHSNRADRPFVAINCSAIPMELLESELFGHERGAFTGATSQRLGLFDEADKGTLFLDEIGDLPQKAQVKLLRVLQDGEIKRVGDNGTHRVDVRILAATNADLHAKMAAGQFREDLYYRLQVIVIRVPPLRQRRDDIMLLAYHFLRKYARRMNRNVTRIGVDAMRLLREHRWPGNVREIEHAVEHAVVMARGSTIVPGDLPFCRDRASGSPEDADESDAFPAVSRNASLADLEALTNLPFPCAKRRAMQLFEQVYLEALLRRTSGNVSEAARQAGLDRSNFRRALKKAAVSRKIGAG